jgi:predicted transglutaminase-like cysteine proteinase
MFRWIANSSFALLALGALSTAQADEFTTPAYTGGSRLQLGELTLAPLAHVRFCMQYANDCRASRIMFRPARAAFHTHAWRDLTAVNAAINAAIKPQRNTGGVLNERWEISPASGDCNDFAVTKQHALLKRGWSSRHLLLAEVIVPSGQHHLVLVAHTEQGDVVLDNLSSKPRRYSQLNYRWVRMQAPNNPRMWVKVDSDPAVPQS